MLKLPIVEKIIREFKKNVEGTSERDAYEYINDNIEDYLSGINSATRGSDQLLVMMIGVVNLLVFIQDNWTGPNVKHVEPIVSTMNIDDDLLNPLSMQLADYPHDYSLRELTVDGEVIYKKLSYLQHLQLARAILIHNGDLLSSCAVRNDNYSNIHTHIYIKYMYSCSTNRIAVTCVVDSTSRADATTRHVRAL